MPAALACLPGEPPIRTRLRRIDRWIVGTPWVARTLRADDPLAVDLGFGSSPITTVEWASRLAAVRSDTPVVGLDIDPERVRAGQRIAEGPLLEFRRGGFELAGLVPVLVCLAAVALWPTGALDRSRAAAR